MEKCPKCGFNSIKKELVRYACYDSDGLAKTKRTCLICGYAKLGD